MTNLPLEVSPLIAALDKEFPEQCPSLSMTDRDIWFYAGKRAVVAYLLELQAREEGNDSSQPIVFTDWEEE